MKNQESQISLNGQNFQNDQVSLCGQNDGND